MSVRPRLRSVVMVLCLIGVAHLPALAATKVGFLHKEADKYNPEWREYWGFGRHLEDDGYVSALTEMRPIYRGGWTEDQLYESLKRFNVVVWPMEYEGSYDLTDELRGVAVTSRAALERYVRDGGGLFIIAQAVRYPGDDDEKYNNLLIEGLGARMMHEGVFDPEREFESPQTLVFRPESYFWTENAAGHPVTEGVGRVYLPTRRGSAPAVEAIDYSDDWTVVLSGEDSARSYLVGHDNVLDLDQPGTLQSGPPIAAVREYGRGRILIYAVPYRHLFLNYGNRVWPHISEERGDEEGGHPSDSMKMALNALAWLAEPSLGIEGFGSYEPEPYRPVEYADAVEWDTAEFVAPSDGVKGLVGAHTSFSDGSGTVAEYARAARDAGLGFIVFTDPLELLTAEELSRLKDDCAAVSDDGFYACPGVEYTDRLGIRWCSFGEKIIYPPATLQQRGQTYDYFDGQRLHLTGKYTIDNRLGPNGVLGYDALHDAHVHPANMWWFFRFMPLVYEGTELVEDDYEDYLYSLRDLRWMALSSFTRVRSPARVAAAADACCTVLPRAEHMREWCNSRCGTYHSYSAKSYVTQGPVIEQWWCINPQMENPWWITRGAQRVRLRFAVSSGAGIEEVVVRDANFGVVRRFDGNGEPRLEREFEMVHDRQHYLQLTVTDTEGRRAIGNYWLLYCYKSGLYRCGDNLNTLGSAAVILHPDRHQRLMLAKTFGDVGRVTVRGFDTGSGIASMPAAWAFKHINLAEGTYPPHEGTEMVAGVLDVPMASYDVSITSMDFSSLADRYERGDRCTPSMGGLLPIVRDHPYRQWRETAYILRSRKNFFTTWNHRRPFEGTEDYRGGMIWHEGTMVAREDIPLKPGIGLPLFALQGPGGAEYETSHHLFVLDADHGAVHHQATLAGDLPSPITGTIEPGGYATLMPTDVGYYAFLPGTGSSYAWNAHHWASESGRGRLYIGFETPQDGVIEAGAEIPYRFLFATINARGDGAEISPDLMADTAAAYNLDGGADGYPFELVVGSFEDAEFFFTARAEGNEAVINIGPREMICDLPFRIRGVADNGVAAVWVHGEDYFRFVAVSEGTAYFQQPIDPAVRLWAGNVFVCDDPDVKMTLVMDGRAEGEGPFLEVHNPGADPITATITSPEHTPVFGGWSRTLQLPAGDGVRVELQT